MVGRICIMSLGLKRINPGSVGEKTHKIPVVGLAEKEDTYRRIWLELLKFVNPEGQTVFPPIYSRVRTWITVSQSKREVKSHSRQIEKLWGWWQCSSQAQREGRALYCFVIEFFYCYANFCPLVIKPKLHIEHCKLIIGVGKVRLISVSDYYSHPDDHTRHIYQCCSDFLFC